MAELKIEPIQGEPGRYHVESQSEDFPHLVDISESPPQCSCRWWETTSNPRRRMKGIRIPYTAGTDRATECKHIYAVLQHKEEEDDECPF